MLCDCVHVCVKGQCVHWRYRYVWRVIWGHSTSLPSLFPLLPSVWPHWLGRAQEET